MNSYRRQPESLDPPKAQPVATCPRCGDPEECDPKHFNSMVVCRLGQIAREFKRLNDFMESGEEQIERGSQEERRRQGCPYCGSDDHLQGSPASDRCREQMRAFDPRDDAVLDRDGVER